MNHDRKRWKPFVGGRTTDTVRNTSMAKQIRTLPVMLLLEFMVRTLKDCKGGGGGGARKVRGKLLRFEGMRRNRTVT